MTEQPKAGELLVGAYLKLVEECELVTYNQRSASHGDQIEVDVIGMSPGTENEVFVCEVSTHLGGLNYSRRVESERWADYGSYQSSLATLERKFDADDAYVTDIFESAEHYRFQLWSPVVRGKLVDGLNELVGEFDAKTDRELELIINEAYTERIDELRQKASESTKQHGELGFRLLQILEHLR
ncbi:hypothetical protein [Salinibaculum rarum]|uniref:hypothetical protein n=1 Tax=Salinibaculum rarum TaxID=3058903 RepID=UPI00265F23D7|nr:hypothetical protein [Salinibaculum sp. KK48]